MSLYVPLSRCKSPYLLASILSIGVAKSRTAGTVRQANSPGIHGIPDSFAFSALVEPLAVALHYYKRERTKFGLARALQQLLFTGPQTIIQRMKLCDGSNVMPATFE